MPERGRHDGRLITGAVGFSAGGDFLAVIPLGALLATETGSGFAVAGLFAALWAPSVLLAPLVGRAVDSVENRRLLIAVSVIQALAAAALVPLSHSVPAILGLASLIGGGHALAQAAEFALLPGMAKGTALRKLTGRVETARYMGLTVGPVLGGLLSATGGVDVALAGNAVTFAAVAIAACRLRVKRSGGASEASRPSGRQSAGLGLLLSGRLRVPMVVAVATLVIMTTTWAAGPFFAEDVLTAGELGYGSLMSSWTIGMVFGSTLIAHRVPLRGLAAGIVLAIAIQGAGLAIPTIWLSLPLACLCYSVGGAAHGAKNVLLRTMIQNEVPQDRHGRAAAAYNALRNGAELIALAAGGVLVTTLGARITLSLSGGIPILFALGVLLVMYWHASRRLLRWKGGSPNRVA